MKHLTERELQILKLIAEGNSHKKVADQLSIKRSTVSNTVNKISNKLGFSGIANLTRYALEIGIITKQLVSSN